MLSCLSYIFNNFISMLPALKILTITPEELGQRLDNFLFTRLKGLPKSCLYRLLRQGKIRVNQKRKKPAYRLQPADNIRIPSIQLPPPILLKKPSHSLCILLNNAILFENDALLVMNKPAGIAVHGGSGMSLGIIEALRQMRPAGTYLELAHRLDRETSGCLLIAKKPSLLRQLHALLRDGNIEKTYWTLVGGYWPSDLTEIGFALQKNQIQSGERIVRISATGKTALTRFRIQKRFKTVTLLEAELCTGRTHQIRVHTQQVLHPIAGDEKYGDKSLNQSLRVMGLKRLFLHAYQLRFTSPLTGPFCIKAPLPLDLNQLLNQLDKTDIPCQNF